MRKLIVSMNTTLDGVADGELGWMNADTDQTWDRLFDMLSNVDLLLLGGGMWNDYKNYWNEALINVSFTANEKRYAQYAVKTKHLIFSSTLEDADWKNASIISGDLTQILRQLKRENGKDIQVVGGVQFASSVINTGLVDEYRIMVNPIVLGHGRSIYDNLLSKTSLECTKLEQMDNGVVVLWYKQALKQD